MNSYRTRREILQEASLGFGALPWAPFWPATALPPPNRKAFTPSSPSPLTSLPKQRMSSSVGRTRLCRSPRLPRRPQRHPCHHSAPARYRFQKEHIPLRRTRRIAGRHQSGSRPPRNTHLAIAMRDRLQHGPSSKIRRHLARCRAPRSPTVLKPNGCSRRVLREHPSVLRGHLPTALTYISANDRPKLSGLFLRNMKRLATGRARFR